MKNLRCFWMLMGWMLLFSCGQPPQIEQWSFYHWKTNYTLTEKGNEMIEESGAKKLYLRLFDVDVDRESQRILPKATIQIPEGSSFPVQEIVPVVYLTNAVFKQATTSRELERLAENIADKIVRLRRKKLPENIQLNEIQLDCDWTTSTRAAYFSFIEELRETTAFKKLEEENEGKLQLSSTIRLHQVKYKERTGIPPVDKAVIMFYNMGDLGNIEEKNSILNIATTRKYLRALPDYPLPFDVAFPYYNWGVLYRDGELAGILNGLSSAQLQENFKATQPHFYKAEKDSYIDGTFVYKGDELREESVRLQDLELLKKTIGNHYSKKYSVILYHLNSQLIENTSAHELLQTIGN